MVKKSFSLQGYYYIEKINSKGKYEEEKD